MPPEAAPLAAVLALAARALALSRRSPQAAALLLLVAIVVVSVLPPEHWCRIIEIWLLVERLLR